MVDIHRLGEIARTAFHESLHAQPAERREGAEIRAWEAAVAGVRAQTQGGTPPTAGLVHHEAGKRAYTMWHTVVWDVPHRDPGVDWEDLSLRDQANWAMIAGADAQDEDTREEWRGSPDITAALGLLHEIRDMIAVIKQAHTASSRPASSAPMRVSRGTHR